MRNLSPFFSQLVLVLALVLVLVLVLALVLALVSVLSMEYLMLLIQQLYSVSPVYMYSNMSEYLKKNHIPCKRSPP